MEKSDIIAFNKPKGYVVTRSDNLNRKIVYDILPPWFFNDGWMPIGRLDMETKGLLLFTTDGKLQEELTRPGSCNKLYEVWVRGIVNKNHVEQLLQGVDTSIGILKARSIELKGGASHKSRVLVQLDEGKNRHIRRLFSALKDTETGTPLKVIELKRVKIGNLNLDIKSGEWRYVDPSEI